MTKLKGLTVHQAAYYTDGTEGRLDKWLEMHGGEDLKVSTRLLKFVDRIRIQSHV